MRTTMRRAAATCRPRRQHLLCVGRCWVSQPPSVSWRVRSVTVLTACVHMNIAVIFRSALHGHWLRACRHRLPTAPRADSFRPCPRTTEG